MFDRTVCLSRWLELTKIHKSLKGGADYCGHKGVCNRKSHLFFLYVKKKKNVNHYNVIESDFYM